MDKGPIGEIFYLDPREIVVPPERDTGPIPPELLEPLRASIRRRGIEIPIYVEKRIGTYYLVEGFKRLLLARQLELKEVPVMETIGLPYVKLEPGKPKRMLVDKWYWEDRIIRDPKTRAAKPVKVLVLHVTQEDGERVDKTYSALSTKLQESLLPYIETGQLFIRILEITWDPMDYATEYAVRLI